MLLGYLAGDSYAAAEKTFGRAAALAVAALLLFGLVAWRIRQRRRNRAVTAAQSASEVDPAENIRVG